MFKVLVAFESRIFSFDVNDTTKVIDLKEKVFEIGSLSPDYQQVWYRYGYLRDDNKTLLDYGVTPDSTIIILCRFRINEARKGIALQ
jgi:hypothetical protein